MLFVRERRVALSIFSAAFVLLPHRRRAAAAMRSDIAAGASRCLVVVAVVLAMVSHQIDRSAVVEARSTFSSFDFISMIIA